MGEVSEFNFIARRMQAAVMKMNLNEKKKYNSRVTRTLKRTTTMNVYEQGTTSKEQAMITNNAKPPLFKIQNISEKEQNEQEELRKKNFELEEK